MVAFLASLFLSLAASTGETLNRDGMLYVEAARAFLENGWRAAVATYAWPFYSVGMAGMASLTGLSLESSAHLLDALFMAGTCALVVACGMRQFPEAGWAICLVVLALPGLNEDRDQVLREFGSWFFVLLACWLALRWDDRPRWSAALAIHASLAMAILFRPESAVFCAALVLWQWFAAPAAQRWQRLGMMGSVPLVAFAILALLHFGGLLGSKRLAQDIGRFSIERFNAKAQAMTPAFIEYAREQARIILFFGSLAIVPVKFLGKMGIFIVPLWYALRAGAARAVLARGALFAWAFLMHFLVLCLFVLDLQFLAGRYVGLLLAFSAPFAGYGLHRLALRLPRLRYPALVVAVLLMLGNVVSLSPAKTQYREAGTWLASNVKAVSRVHVESARTAYYAGWHYKPRSVHDREALRGALARDEIDFAVFDLSRKEPDIRPWLESVGLMEVRRFGPASGDIVLIAAPRQRTRQE